MECLIREYKLGQMFLLLQGITLDAAQQPRRVDCCAAVQGAGCWVGGGGGGGGGWPRDPVCWRVQVHAAGGGVYMFVSPVLLLVREVRPWWCRVVAVGAASVPAAASTAGLAGCWHTGTVSSRHSAPASTSTVTQHLPCPGDPRPAVQ